MTPAIAAQIAHLLNQNNNLQGKYSGSRVINSRAVYYPEHFQGLVFGSVAVKRLNFMLSEVKHLVVHPAFRKAGLGKKLLNKAESVVNTPFMIATIREDNSASLRLFLRNHFTIVARTPVKDHITLLLIKANVLGRYGNSKSS